jgi:hypothetical protein
MLGFYGTAALGFLHACSIGVRPREMSEVKGVDETRARSIRRALESLEELGASKGVGYNKQGETGSSAGGKVQQGFVAGGP